MAAKLSKAAQSQITKLKEQLAKAKALGAQKIADQKLAAKEKAAKIKAKKVKTKKVYAYSFDTEPSGAKTKKPTWMGAVPKKLTVYKVRLMLDEQQIGIFGPYATIRAASADAKNILRMHVGPGYKIEEIGVDEPLLRSDGNVKVYFHPSVYSAQATDKGVLTAQVIEQGGEAQRKKAFVKKYNPARARSKKTPYDTKFNRDGTVTLWDVYAQSWSRTSHPSDRDLAAMDAAERARVIRHLKLNPSRPRKNGTRRDVLQEYAHKAGYLVETYSPGDGVTRYKFFSLAEMARKGISEREQSYFGPLDGVGTARGLAAAKKWLAKH